MIKKRVVENWGPIDFFENVLLVLTVPAEFPERSKAILRECVFNAGLLEEIHSTNLQFTTEREKIHYLSKIIMCVTVLLEICILD